MNHILINAGFISIVVLIIYVIKKTVSYFFDKTDLYISDKVYDAADAFSEGAEDEEIKSIMSKCIDFDKDDIEEVLSKTRSCRGDEDGGYQSFLQAVKKVLKRY